MGIPSRTLILVLALGTVTACAPSSSAPGPSSSPPSSTTPPGSSPPPSSPSTRPPGSPTTKPKPGEVTIRGTAAAGVEAGCVVFRTDGGELYLLLGGDRDVIAPGLRLEVVGRPEPNTLTTCQQGTPFRVSQARVI